MSSSALEEKIRRAMEMDLGSPTTAHDDNDGDRDNLSQLSAGIQNENVKPQRPSTLDAAALKPATAPRTAVETGVTAAAAAPIDNFNSNSKVLTSNDEQKRDSAENGDQNRIWSARSVQEEVAKGQQTAALVSPVTRSAGETSSLAGGEDTMAGSDLTSDEAAVRLGGRHGEEEHPEMAASVQRNGERNGKSEGQEDDTLDNEIDSSDRNSEESPVTANGGVQGVSKSPTRQSRPASPGSKLYERALAKRAEQDRKRQEAIQREASFSPKLVSSKKIRENRGTTPGKSRYEMLYADAATRQQQMQRRVSENTTPDGCTFTPKTTRYRRKSSVDAANKDGSAPTTSADGSVGDGAMPGTPGSVNESGARDSPGTARRSESLYANAKALQAKRKSLLENRLREEVKECSFTPKITARAQAKRAASPGPTARMTELYQEAKAKEARIQAAKERRELEGCTFQPNINRRRSSSGAAAPTPSPDAVQERLARFQKDSERRREKLRQAQLEKEREELTFQPNIRTKSRPSTPQRGPSQAAIHERLYSEATKQRKQREAAEAAKDAPDGSKAVKRPPSPGVFDRLATPKTSAGASDTREEQLAIEELKECTFSPNTRPGSAPRSRRSVGSAAGLTRGSSGGPSEAIWNRLSKEHDGVRELRDEMRKQRELSECTFKPTINGTPSASDKASADNVSRASSSTPIWQRLTDEGKRAKQREEELARKKEAQELADCTFQPKISKHQTEDAAEETSSSKAGSFKESKPIWERLADTKTLAEKQDALERQRAESELKNCTFAPQLSPKEENPKSLKSPTSPTSASTANGTAPSLSYLDRIAQQSRSSSSRNNTPAKSSAATISSTPAQRSSLKKPLKPVSAAKPSTAAKPTPAKSTPAKATGTKPAAAKTTGTKPAATKPAVSQASSQKPTAKPKTFEGVETASASNDSPASEHAEPAAASVPASTHVSEETASQDPGIEKGISAQEPSTTPVKPPMPPSATPATPQATPAENGTSEVTSAARTPLTTPLTTQRSNPRSDSARSLHSLSSLERKIANIMIESQGDNE
mmetsp:Transcript_10670/g.21008  ORF Transcript_10670/g.21008 Transcript_10670/m.21008 type:complete len:1055 (-) Transcript_10670:69-3233(-)|eukprot:CAMPEP_0171573790 /NCGR_PEP_ID=MMETSP0961-20121227/4965_1 /TAXON_ID=87120 /ORGANISM="Aurantiochytrium limacinum, Strain ATCCMYA-1381" /LENGTH=1054 /DNA_ID=CAMNT_0012128969 /DNA_START=75 /DNA_END=3239 /DNA_ORIENTATION=+